MRTNAHEWDWCPYKDPRELTFCHVRLQGEVAVNEEVGPHWTLDSPAPTLDFPASRTMSNQCRVYEHHLWCVVKQPGQTVIYSRLARILKCKRQAMHLGPHSQALQPSLVAICCGLPHMKLPKPWAKGFVFCHDIELETEAPRRGLL